MQDDAARVIEIEKKEMAEIKAGEEAVAREHAPVEMWRRIVDSAIAEQVDALLIAGDIVDHDRGFFEALDAIEGGIKRLDSAGIRCIAVAGNHDVEVMKRLRRTLETDNFDLLGQGGRWECVQLAGHDGGRHTDVWGWSFPQSQVTTNPMPQLTADMLEPGTPSIGLLHCDRGAGSDSVYCPVPGGDFARSGIGTWVLGHVHKPASADSVRSEPRNFYAGSPQPLRLCVELLRNRHHPGQHQKRQRLDVHCHTEVRVKVPELPVGQGVGLYVLIPG